MPLDGRQLTYKQALALCYRVGWRGRDLTRAVAVMCAESARYTGAYNVNTNGTVDRGLFQINSVHANVSDTTAFDPLSNAEFAHELWTHQGFRPWYAFVNKNHLKFIPMVLAARLLKWHHLVPHIEYRIREGGAK